MATAQHPLAPVEQGAVPATTCPPKGSPSPEWHELRVFGWGRHPVNFDAGRERAVEL